MILVDTSVIVAWLDPDHPEHQICSDALDRCSAMDELAISSITYAELAAGGRNREALDEDLRGFLRLDLDFHSAYRAGQAFGRYHAGKTTAPVLPDFLIRGQAAHLGLRHLTNDRRHIRAFPDIDFLFPVSKT
ncbi:MAG TPA: type II toxin-antitoxin system VapC family toxin [Verrucomicrobiae bacterium]|nr:type II toxin-antitoxin system VapC family toxin [Verrucomicrobiae bacterium]